jgi:hypothetical protein
VGSLRVSNCPFGHSISLILALRRCRAKTVEVDVEKNCFRRSHPEAVGATRVPLHNGVATIFAPEARAARRRARKIPSCVQADDARAGSGSPLPH